MSRVQSRVRLLAVATAVGWMLLLGGCSTLSGVGGEPRYACQAPTGAQCTSVSGVYANTGRHFTVPPFVPALITGEGTLTDPTASPPQRGMTAAPASGAAPQTLRSPPRLLRLWIAPWEDSEGDLHEGSAVHMVVDIGRWRIDRVRPASRQPVFAMPPSRFGTTPPGSSPPQAPRAADTLAPISLTEP